MWMGGMQQAQVEILVRTFAFLTEEGWVIPEWIHSLSTKIQERDRIELLINLRPE